MSVKKVLIVAYYWPPLGGSGVQRWLKFVKCLPKFGWTPYVFTPANPTFAIQDKSFEKDIPPEAEVIRFPIWEPYDFFFRISQFFGIKKNTSPYQLFKTRKRTTFDKVSTWIRGNLIFPDPRVFWVKPSVKYLERFLRENDIDIVITTSPPHSLQLIGYELKKRIPNLTWIADFRDPWSQWFFLDGLMLTSWQRRRHGKLEAKILKSADIVTTITPFHVRQFEKLGGRPVTLLTNGFDEDDFRDFSPVRSDKFIMRHAGLINELCNPRPLMETLKQMMIADREFAENLVVEFIGDVHTDFKRYIQESSELSRVTRFVSAMPHDQLIDVYQTSSILLLFLTGYNDPEGFMPGKIFEYIATGLPVLGMGPENGDSAEALRLSGAGRMYHDTNRQGMTDFVSGVFSQWKDGAVKLNTTAGNTIYSRTTITGQLVDLLEKREHHFST